MTSGNHYESTIRRIENSTQKISDFDDETFL